MSQPSERNAVLAVINPGTVTSTPALTGAVDMSKYDEAQFILCSGDMASETIDFKLQESDTSGGTYTDIPGKAITQQAASATANDNLQWVINLKANELSAGKRFVKGRAVTGGATGGPMCCIALGTVPRFGPASDDDVSTVDEIIT